MKPLHFLLALILLTSALFAGPADDTVKAVAELRHGLILHRDIEVAADGTLTSYHDPKHRPQPTAQQIADQIAATHAAAAAKAAFVAARQQMHTLFESLPLITKARLRDEFVIINTILDSGRADSIAEAKLRVQAVTRPADSELTDDEFDAAKAAMVALFP